MKKTYPSIPGLEPDAWSNDACRGYVIMAMHDCGFPPPIQSGGNYYAEGYGFRGLR